jgi:hypothetical protein
MRMTTSAGGGAISTLGDGISALSGDPRAQLRSAFSATMGGIAGVFTPRSVKNTLITGFIRASVDKAGLEAINQAMGPACDG